MCVAAFMLMASSPFKDMVSDSNYERSVYFGAYERKHEDAATSRPALINITRLSLLSNTFQCLRNCHISSFIPTLYFPGLIDIVLFSADVEKKENYETHAS